MAFDLLPEKYSLWKKYKIDGIYILFIVILPLCLFGIKFTYLMQQQASLQERIQSYREELQSFSVMHASDEALQFAHTSLLSTVKLWQILGDSINASMCVSEIYRNKHKITLSGQAQSMQHLQQLADKLQDAHLFKYLSIARITDTKKQDGFEFKLHLNLQDDQDAA